MDSKTIFFRTHIGTLCIKPSDIIYCKAEGAYTDIITTERKITISKNLKLVENLIQCNILIKCHKSYLVNLNYIEKICKNCEIVLKNNNVIPISRRQRTKILKLNYTLAD